MEHRQLLHRIVFKLEESTDMQRNRRNGEVDKMPVHIVTVGPACDTVTDANRAERSTDLDGSASAVNEGNSSISTATDDDMDIDSDNSPRSSYNSPRFSYESYQVLPPITGNTGETSLPSISSLSLPRPETTTIPAFGALGVMLRGANQVSLPPLLQSRR
ncbi:hypothetical protein NKR19_g3733 [Coniochaeta hoffmannii]|uniref:Uncharacterized protein n=1 Tax=Coniochaeta hoffmannii TaxID=91930 RepID=A0AA38S346_9PEZI|nr:hypothetical protein NKR19_g3733 [Coniochaeta hoffmannii]